MLDGFLRIAIELGADVLEFEFDGDDIIVMAIRGTTGTGVGSLGSKSKECGRLIDAIRELRRSETVRVGETVYPVSISEHEGFGEWACHLELGKAKGR